MSLETAATLAASHVLIFGIGVSIGTMIVKNGLFEKVWDANRDRRWRNKDPRRHCPHVRIELLEDGSRMVVEDIRLNEARGQGWFECRRCGTLVNPRDRDSWFDRDLSMWKAQPDLAEKRIQAAEKRARKNRGWTPLDD